MLPFFNKRRNIVLVAVALVLVFVAFSSSPTLDTDRIKSIIPGHATPSKNGHGVSSDGLRTSQLHYLVPASGTNIQLCYNLVSSIVNRYPAPMLLGWHGDGLLDASTTHLAKIRAIQRYFHQLPEVEDDDLVAIVDGYDIIMQLPPDILIERYYQLAEAADKRLADRFGLSVNEVRAQGMRQTVFWGPDKICWPTEWEAARCWAVPTSNLPPKAFGPKSGNGEMYYNDPRWLNSGTVIGPVSDVRDLIDATILEIEATYDANFKNSESDQFYIANIWGRQEYARSLAVANGDPDKIPGDSSKRKVPELREEDQRVEYHIALDYESALFQTKAGYEPFFGYLQYNQSGLKAQQTNDMFKLGKDFKPYEIGMGKNVATSLGKLYDAIPEAHPGSDSSDWLKIVELGTNFVSKYVYLLWHCTGPKGPIDDEYPTLWFYPYVRSLLKAAVKASQAGEAIRSTPINGRHWVAKTWYPEESESLGGAWTDQNGTTFAQWSTLCSNFEQTLFGGEAGFEAIDEEEIATEAFAQKAANNEPVQKEGEASIDNADLDPEDEYLEVDMTSSKGKPESKEGDK
jgi:hypothetical protein